MEINKGDLVKVRIQDGVNSERVWAKVLETFAETQEILIELNNHPVSPVFKFGEQMKVPVSFVLDKYDAPQEKE